MLIMNNNHPMWEEFCDDMEYCLFNPQGASKCEHTTTITRYVLSHYYGVDVGASLEAFHQLGGFCDCEIFYNLLFEEE